MHSILISGAAQGIGAAIAQLFYQQGYRVGIYDIHLAQAQQLADQLGERAHAGLLDVADYASWQAALSDFFSPKNKGENTEVQLGKVMTKDGTLTIEFDGDTVSVGTEMFLTNEMGEKLPVPDGEYTLEDDMVAVMVDSKVAELKPAAEEEEAPVAMDNTPTSEPAGTANVKSEKFTQEVFYQLAQVVGAELEKFKTDLRAEFETKLADVKPEAVSLTKQKGEQKQAEPKNAKERLFNKINQVK